MSIVAVIQARMGSSRLPGKTLMEIAGKPLLAHVVERVRASRVDAVVVATTTGPEEEALVALAEKLGVGVYRGSAEDVLDRYYQAATRANATIVVRATADDPFKDPDVIDRVIATLCERPELDYASNTLEPTYPEGLDIEVFRMAALERAWREAALPSEREHVTPYIWKHPERFAIANVRHAEDLSALRWTLDYEEDLAFARAIAERLASRGMFRMADILALLAAEPALGTINQGIVRNAGYQLSLQKDQAQ